MQSGDFLTDVLRVVSCCGCRMNWAAASQIALCNLSLNTKNNPPITTIPLASLQPG